MPLCAPKIIFICKDNKCHSECTISKPLSNCCWEWVQRKLRKKPSLPKVTSPEESKKEGGTQL